MILIGHPKINLALVSLFVRPSSYLSQMNFDHHQIFRICSWWSPKALHACMHKQAMKTCTHLWANKKSLYLRQMKCEENRIYLGGYPEFIWEDTCDCMHAYTHTAFSHMPPAVARIF